MKKEEKSIVRRASPVCEKKKLFFYDLLLLCFLFSCNLSHVTILADSSQEFNIQEKYLPQRENQSQI